jgi:hypothetical protein
MCSVPIISGLRSQGRKGGNPRDPSLPSRKLSRLKQTFREVNAKSVVLWIGSVTYKENIELLHLDYNKSLKPLDSSRLSFSLSWGKSVHIVVNCPTPGELSYATHIIESPRVQL